MAHDTALDPAGIRAMRDDFPKLRDRDLADKIGTSEAELVAAHCGHDAIRITAHPDALMPAAETLGEVMALTRNVSCVHEKIGLYANYHSGPHASMVLAPAIDLRIFPSHWQHAFLVERDAEAGTRRSLQVFDAAGDAVHKIHLRDGSDLNAWEVLKRELAQDDQSDTLKVSERAPTEAPKGDPARRDVLVKEWQRLTDTHQFLRLTAKLKMNRLGAYRIAREPFARLLAPAAVDDMLHAVRDAGIEVMVFTGNRGCIQIHSGPIGTLTPMGPWQNVMDPDFNLHLRLDRVAEVWAVEKPTQRGPAVSVEAFDAEGGLIFQVFGVGKEGRDSRPRWNQLVAGLEGATEEAL